MATPESTRSRPKRTSSYSLGVLRSQHYEPSAAMSRIFAARGYSLTPQEFLLTGAQGAFRPGSLGYRSRTAPGVWTRLPLVSRYARGGFIPIRQITSEDLTACTQYTKRVARLFKRSISRRSEERSDEAVQSECLLWRISSMDGQNGLDRHALPVCVCFLRRDPTQEHFLALLKALR